jgi:adenylate kinase
LTDSYHVVYLTGPPATGKSSLLKGLEKAVHPLHSFSYSTVLAKYLGERDQRVYAHDEMRKHSAGIVTANDIAAVDELLVKFVRENRSSTHIIIDSHAVAKETFGFRVTPFNLRQIEEIKPTMIVCLYAAPETIINRISAQPEGRQVSTIFEAAMHSELQASVAIAYGVHLGLPVYFFDSDRPKESLVAELARRLLR